MPRGSSGASSSSTSGGHPGFRGVEQSLHIMRQVQPYLSVGMDHVLEVAADMAEYGRAGEDEEVNNLRKMMLNYIRMDRDMHNFITATNNVIAEGSDCQEEGGLKRMLDEQLVELSRDNDDSGLRMNDKYKELEQKIQDSLHPDAASGSVRDRTPSEEDGIEMTAQEMNTRCPYTGKEMVDPVYNVICKHTYDRTGITAYIKQRGKKAKCPVGGCGNQKPLTVKDLEDNKEMRRYIQGKRKHTQGSSQSQSRKRSRSGDVHSDTAIPGTSRM